MTTTHAPQISFDDEVIDSPELVAALERREKALEELKPKRKAYNREHDQAKALVEQLELPDGTYRCGPYLVTTKPAEETHIEFDRASFKRISFKRSKTN